MAVNTWNAGLGLKSRRRRPKLSSRTHGFVPASRPYMEGLRAICAISAMACSLAIPGFTRATSRRCRPHSHAQALELDESSAPSHLNMAEAWMGLGEVDRAMTEYARALELDADILSEGAGGITAQVTTPEQRARVSYLIAKAYAKRGNLDGALEYLRRAKDGHFADLGRVYKDQEFAALWPDPRLEQIVKR